MASNWSATIRRGAQDHVSWSLETEGTKTWGKGKERKQKLSATYKRNLFRVIKTQTIPNSLKQSLNYYHHHHIWGDLPSFQGKQWNSLMSISTAQESLWRACAHSQRLPSQLITPTSRGRNFPHTQIQFLFTMCSTKTGFHGEKVFSVLAPDFQVLAFSGELGRCFLWVQRKGNDSPTTCYSFHVYNQN